MDLAGKKINFLGDSITAGSGTKGKENIYLNVLKEKEHLAEARNYGIGGTRIARQSTYLTDTYAAFCDRYNEMDDDADIVVVFGGTNDYGHGDAPIGTMTDRTPDTFYGACHILMEGLLNKYPTGTIVFMTPVQRSASQESPKTTYAKCDVALIDYVNIIKEVAAYYSIPVLDLYSVASIHPALESNRKQFCPDGLHPNNAGHLIIESRLAGFLKSL